MGTGGELCIFIRQVERQRQFITAKGRWLVTIDSARSCKIDHFVNPEELEPLLPYLPNEMVQGEQQGPLPLAADKVGDFPIHVARPLMQKIRDFASEMDAFRRRHSSAFEEMYDKLAHEEDLTEWRIEALIPRVFGFPSSELSPAGLLALDGFCAYNDGIFAFKEDLRPFFYWVRAKKHLRSAGDVRDWGRRYQESAAKAAMGADVKAELASNPLSAFINKAHRLITKSRKDRSPTTIGMLGPSGQRVTDGAVTAIPTGEVLTTSDRKILDFILEEVHKRPPLSPYESRTICALIYRAIGAYPEVDLGTKVGRLLLQELGVISPWFDTRLNNYHGRLPGLRLWPYQTRLLHEAEASCQDLDKFVDGVKHIRKDWGDTPVYCIDSADTLEIDDGISIVRDVTAVEYVWIHVHIANPAAYISPHHPIAMAARESLCSTYTPSQVYRMMPPMFSQHIASLAKGRATMTVSTLIRPDGSVADINVSMGVVHNVIKLLPDRIQAALGERVEEMATMVIGGTPREPRLDAVHEERLRQAMPDLRLLKDVLNTRQSQRRAEWPAGEHIERTKQYIRVDTSTTYREKDHQVSLNSLYHWQGDPIITVEGNRFPIEDGQVGIDRVVEHAMLIAGESMATWCSHRGVPIVYHVATPHIDFPVWKLNQLEDDEFRRQPEAKMSSRAQPHWHLQMHQYTRVSSPIRRFTDLVNQWQIQAYLEAEQAASLQQGGGPVTRVSLEKLPFSVGALQTFTDRADSQTRLLKALGSLNEERWIYIALFRALHFKEAELPAVWDMKVLGAREIYPAKPDHTGVVGKLYPFKAHTELLRSEAGWEKEIVKGQYLPVKLEVIDPDYETVFVRAVGRPSDTVCTAQPIHIRSSLQSSPAPANDGIQQI